jgi:hypothetical protein
MITRKLRKRLVIAATIGACVMTALTLSTAGIASATVPDPPGGSTPVYPSFNDGIVSAIRSSGSDTIFFVSQAISDLYTGAGLEGCTLNYATGQTLYNSSESNTNSAKYNFYCQANDNQDTTDTVDNWNRTEVYTGVDEVGSSGGQAQLCGESDGTGSTGEAPSPFTVDFARSSKPSDGLTGCNEQEVGFAKDGVPVVVFTTIVPGSYGASAQIPNANGGTGLIGPVAAGWLPGDNINGPYSGTELNLGTGQTGPGISNGQTFGSALVSDPTSVAYELWCQSNATTSTQASPQTEITDWGQLTNLGPDFALDQVTATNGSDVLTLPVGENFSTSLVGGTLASASSNASALDGLTVSSVSNFVPPGGNPTATGVSTATLSGNYTGTTTTNTNGGDASVKVNTSGSAVAIGTGQAIGIPIRIEGINSGSGTFSTFSKFAASGTGVSNCADNNAAGDPNPNTINLSDNSTPPDILENNASNIQLYNADYWPGDYADQALDDATTITYESNGVFNTNPHAEQVTVDGTNYSGVKVEEDSKTAGTSTEFPNQYPTARTLFNIINSQSVRYPTAGYLNWLCDNNSNYNKGTDPNSGLGYNAELFNIITNEYGFDQLTDSDGTTPANNPVDGQPAPNNTCDAGETVTNSSGTDTLNGTFPSSIFPGATESVTNTSGSETLTGTFPAGLSLGTGVSGTGIPTGTTVTATSWPNTVTLSNPTTAAVTSVAYAGWTVSGTGIPSGTVVTGNSGTVLTLSSSTTAAATTVSFPGEPPVLGAANQ